MPRAPVATGLRLLAGWVLAMAAARASAGELSVSSVGRFDFIGGGNDDPALVAEELSGITRVSGDRYLAVSDQHACIHNLTIRVDVSTGRIITASLGEPIRLRDASGKPLPEPRLGPDREGIAYDPASRSVWLANEKSGALTGRPSLERYSLETGNRTGRVDPTDAPSLGVFSHTVTNNGFESLTRRGDGPEYWIANEDTLPVDGERSSTKSGALVRLQRLDGDMRPIAQYAYVTEAVAGEIKVPPQAAGLERSGVSDLCVLPDGRLLVLEREFSGGTGGLASSRIRVYHVDYDAATDISLGETANGLLGKDFTAAAKTLLIDLRPGPGISNFEGMTLGPVLDNGDRSLILIADNNGGIAQALYALRLRHRDR